MSKFTFKIDEKIVIKVVLLGDGAVGKTTLKNRYISKGFQERYMPTLGADITIKTLNVQKESFECHFWDLAGQPKFNAIRQNYYRGSRGAILVYDITQPDSLPNLNMWIQELHNNIIMKKIPLIIVGNKIDLRNTIKSTIPTEKGLEFLKHLKSQIGSDREAYFFETSAKTGENVSKVFEILGEALLRVIKRSE
ncbi:MAG: Rab family GTPase [Candidatus Hermodarchaeota archaeon]